MKHDVEKGRTLLVDGPASVRLLSGESRVLGAPLNAGDKIVIREGNACPLRLRKGQRLI